jgi:hypothetical protein
MIKICQNSEPKMEYIVVILGILLLAVSVAGTVIPGLPGPILALGSLVLVLFNPHAKANIEESNYIWLAAIVVLTALVYLVSRRIKNSKVEGTNGRVAKAANIQVINILIIAFYFIAVHV